MIKIILTAVTLFLFHSVSCTSDSKLKGFKSDGCSLFPDKALIVDLDWCECCFVHDISYWQGGTADEREVADIALKECIYEKTGDKNLAEIMFRGVRFGGSAYFPNWYRWGYGWAYSRKYKPLSEDEKIIVKELLKAFYSDTTISTCK